MKIEIGGIQPAEIILIYIFRCSHCPEAIEQEWRGQGVDKPEWPGPGWQRIMGVTPSSINRWICPKHKVEIAIDGFAVAIP